MKVICNNYLECNFKNCYHVEEHEPDKYCHLYCQHLEKIVHCIDKKILDRKLKIEKLNKLNV